MTRPRLAAVLLSALCSTIAIGAHAQESPRSAIEAGGFVGYGRMLAPSVDHDREQWSRSGGAQVSAMVLYRSPHFLSPYLEVGYAQLYASRESVDTPDLGTLESDNSLSALSLVGGPALDLWRFRIRGGVGLYRVHVHSTVLGVTIDPAEYDLGWFASAGGHVYRSPHLRLGFELRSLLISEASTVCVGLGLTGTGDVLSW